MFTLQRQVKVKPLMSVAAILLAWSMVARAEQTLTGKWRGETNNGAAIVLDLVVKGTALTGTLTRNGVSTPVSEGKVSKNSFTFKAELSDQTEKFSGELADNQIKIWLDRQGASRAIVLKRVKG